jgi:hypothetical protein
MKHGFFDIVLALILVPTVVGLAAPAAAETESPAQAGEQVGVQGQFVRVATNAEGWVVLSYRTANDSVGQEWMLLDVGITVQAGAKDQKLAREAVSLVAPDDQVLPLPSQKEYMDAAGSLRGLNARANVASDSINYFPPGANIPCRIGFFADAAQPGRTLAYDEVELSSQRACLGRLYFQVPGGIQLGLYNLDVKFADSTVRVPIKIMTKDEAKEFEQQWKQELKASKKKGDDKQ